MSTHYCKVGKTKPNLNKSFSLKALKDKTVQFVEVVYNQKSSNDFDVAS